MASIEAIKRTFSRENRSMGPPHLRVDTIFAADAILSGHQLSRDDPPSPPPQPPPSPVGWAYATSDNRTTFSTQVSSPHSPAMLVTDYITVRRPSKPTRGLD